MWVYFFEPFFLHFIIIIYHDFVKNSVQHLSSCLKPRALSFLFTVTLSVSSDSTYFKGFLIEARDAVNPDGGSVGSFTLSDPSISQLLSCHHREVSNSTISR